MTNDPHPKKRSSGQGYSRYHCELSFEGTVNLQTSSRSLLTQTKHDSTISETYLPVSTLTTKPIQASSIATAASDAIVAMLVIYLLIVKGRGKKETGHGKVFGIE